MPALSHSKVHSSWRQYTGRLYVIVHSNMTIIGQTMYFESKMYVIVSKCDIQMELYRVKGIDSVLSRGQAELMI